MPIKKQILIIVVALLAVNIARAACTVPTDNLVPAANTITTLCNNQTWQINDTDGFGIITLTAASGNATLDCNGTTLIGYGTGRGINTNGVINATIKNCNVSGYTRAYNIQATKNSTLLNNQGYNGTNGINLVSPVDSCLFDNNSLENFTTFGISGAVNNSIFQNNSGKRTIYGIWLATADRNIIRYNTYYNMTSACIRLQTSTLADVNNNNLSECVGQGITTDASNNTNITRNNISDVQSLSAIGINIGGTDGINNRITYNRLFHVNQSQSFYSYGIRINNISAMNNVIQNNTVTNYYENIQTLANNTNIEDNKVVNASWNNIQYYSYHNKVHNNSIINYGHHGIDTHNQDDKNRTESGDSNVTQNTITMQGTPIFKGDAAIFLSFSKKNNVLANQIYNLTNSAISETSTMGLACEGGDYSFDNVFQNNNVNNVQGTCVYDDALNNTYINNAFLNCQSNYTVTTFGSWDIPNNKTYANFTNNNATNFTAYFQQNNRSNISIAQNTAFNVKDGGYNGNVVRLVLYYPYKDVYVNGSYAALNLNSYETIVNMSLILNVGDYSCAKHYQDSGIAYSCNTTNCYFTNTNCTVKTGRTS